MEVRTMITEQMINQLEEALIEEIRSTLNLWRMEKQEGSEHE